MRRTRIVFCLLVFLAGHACAATNTVVEALCRPYRQLESVTCTVSRKTKGSDHTLRALSRIAFARGHRLRVDAVLRTGTGSTKKCIIADGTTLYARPIEGMQPVVKPIAQLDPATRIEVERVPGTPMDHLLRLRGSTLAGTVTTNGMTTVTCEQGSRRAELVIDRAGRLTHLTLYGGADTQDMATYAYSDYREVAPGTWVPMRHLGTIRRAGHTFTETVQVGGYVVNSVLPQGTFDPRYDFADVAEDGRSD